MVVTANTIKFLERIFTQFFWRQKPDSTQAKPRFMKNTSMPVIIIQTVSAPTLSSFSLFSIDGSAGAEAPSDCPVVSAVERFAGSDGSSAWTAANQPLESQARQAAIR